MKELPPAGSGNGGRTCFSCSCVILVLTTLFACLMFLPPLFTDSLTHQDTFAVIGDEGFLYFMPSFCLSSCCCLGVVFFFLSIWLILIDDPSKAK